MTTPTTDLPQITSPPAPLITSLSSSSSSSIAPPQISPPPNPIAASEIAVAAFQIFKTELLAYYSKHNGKLGASMVNLSDRFPQDKKERRKRQREMMETQEKEKRMQMMPSYEHDLAARRQFANARIYNIGKALAVHYMPLSLQKYQAQRYTTNLDLIKHLCRHIYPKIRLYPVDNLKTNHKGVFVIREMRAIEETERVFVCGVMRGVLMCITQGEVKIGCDVKEITETGRPPRLETVYKIILPEALDGAGISTESNIPDYRSPGVGSYSKGHTPMTLQVFMKSHENRQRYYARNMLGFERFRLAKPNRVHHMIHAMEEEPVRRVGKIITQNVDGLHQAAGSRPEQVIELHGSNHEMICVNCRQVTARESYQERLVAANRAFFDEMQERLRHVAQETNRSDGDVSLDEIVTDFSHIEVPECLNCGGIMKPNVVFFGENMDKRIKERGDEAVQNSDALLVLGSSVMVFSSYRLILMARKLNMPVCMVTLGETRADGLDGILKIEHNVGDVLESVLKSVPFESL